MKAKRRRHEPEFKARVALEALKGIQTIQQIAKEFDIHPMQVTEWKNNPLFPRLRSGHPLFQRPSPQKQIPSIPPTTACPACGSTTASIPETTHGVKTTNGFTPRSGNTFSPIPSLK
jgi:hypothetical protein